MSPDGELVRFLICNLWLRPDGYRREHALQDTLGGFAGAIRHYDTPWKEEKT